MKQEIYIKDRDYKIYVMSDIHAHYELLKNMVEKLDLKEEDYLILLGDYINRGPESLKSLEFVWELSKRKNTFVLTGNHEASMHQIITNKEFFSEIAGRILKSKTNPISEILKRDHINYVEYSSEQLYDYLNSKKDFLNQLKNLSTIVYTDDFVFIHSGYDKDFTLENKDKYLRWDHYNEESAVNEKIVVVGHMPAMNFRDDVMDTRPYFNKEKNIIFIDGGLGLKVVSELNCLVIDKKEENISYDILQENIFEEKIIEKEIFLETEEDVLINYPDYKVEILENKGQFSICRYLKNNKKFTVFTSMIENGYIKCNYSNHFLNLKVGNIVSICYYYEDYAFVKYKNEFGWIKKESLEL